MTIGTRIRQIRDAKNIKQEDMAKKLNMSQSNYSRIETNEIKANDEALERIAEIFGMHKEQLLDSEGSIVNFNNSPHSYFNKGTVHNYAISPEIKQLYDDKIALLEEKIKWLEKR
jgi:transcriptional regulator with XRE-family HTH domain